MGVVVLGANGRLGRLLRPVFPVPADWYGRADVDIRDGSALRAVLRGAGAVLCLAGVTNGRDAPMSANRDLALRTVEAARDVGSGRVFVFSSAAVYGNLAGPLREDGDTAPLSPYGAAKLEMEAAVATHDHPVTALRLGNVAGADAILGGWAPDFALDTLSDGSSPARSYIGPVTLARVLCDLCVTPDLPSVLNLAAPGTVEMGTLLNAAGLAWRPRPADRDTIARVALDTALLERFTAFDARDSAPEEMVAQWRLAYGAS